VVISKDILPSVLGLRELSVFLRAEDAEIDTVNRAAIDSVMHLYINY
jgi:hypothetical protein